MKQFILASALALVAISANAATTYPVGHWEGGGTQTTNGTVTNHGLDLTITATNYTAIYKRTSGATCTYSLDYACDANGICTYSQNGDVKGTGYCMSNVCSMTGAWENSCSIPVSGTMNLIFNADGSVDRFGSNGSTPTLLMDHSTAK